MTRDLDVDVNRGVHAQQPPTVNEARKALDKNAIAIIVNEDNKFLLLKRGDKAPWMPSKWSLIGGAVEKGETPEQACKRETKEETGLELKEFVKTFSVQRRPESVEHIFAVRHKGEDTEIELDEENTSYGWYDLAEIKFLDTVPNLVEYILLAFKEYE